MKNPFEGLFPNPSSSYDEWGGQFDCDTVGCNGWASVAKYFPKLRVLAWECQEGHVSKLENVDE